MIKYNVLHYDHFYKMGHDLKGCFIFNTLEEAEKFVKDREEAKKKYKPMFDNDEYIIKTINVTQ